MYLLEMHQYHGLLDRVLSFLGRGREHCLPGIASKDALSFVAQITGRGSE